MQFQRSRIATAVNNTIAVGVVLILLVLLLSVFGLTCNFNRTPYAPFSRAGDIQIIKTSTGYESIGNETVRYVYCTVRNVSGQLISAANFTAVYYDRNNRVVGTGVGTGINIPAGSTRVVTITAVNIYDAVSYAVETDAAF